MADLGNAVDAKWVGPSGFQLFDGTVLNPGDIVRSIGFDEANNSPYWEPVKVGKNDTPVADATPTREDWSIPAPAAQGPDPVFVPPTDPVKGVAK